MPWSAPRQCPTPGCPILLRGKERCPKHRPSFTATAYAKGAHPVPPAKRRAVLRRAHGRCERCGAPASDVDHIVSHANGGTDAWDNLQALCEPCHRSKTGREGYEAARRRR
jgi:5-methylcytosine-specific restriction protein A